MYVSINNNYVQIDIASDILGIDKQDLIDAGHTVKSKTEVSSINYSNYEN